MKIKHNKFLPIKNSEFIMGGTHPKFSLGDRDRDEISPICSFNTCRESLSFALRDKIRCNEINTRILRLIMWFCPSKDPRKVVNKKIINLDKEQYFNDMSIKYDKTLSTAVDTLNTIEKELKWRKSIIQKLEHKFSNRHNLYLVMASPKWMFSPPLISLYLLILRSGTLTGVSKSKSIREFVIKCKEISNNAVLGQKSDIEHLKLFAPKLQKFLTNVGNIYKKRTQKMNFSRTVLTSGSGGFSEGMLKLVKADTGDKHILKEFQKYTGKKADTGDKHILKGFQKYTGKRGSKKYTGKRGFKYA